jgi:tape measure domain-containing protein
MATVVGGLTVYLEDDTSRFQSSLRNNASLVEQQSQRMTKALGGAAKSAEELGRKAGNFQLDGFRALAISALRTESSLKRLELTAFAVGAALGGGFLGTAAARTLKDYADTYTNLTNRVKAVTEGTADQAKAQQDLFQIAQRSRSTLESTFALYGRIKATSPALAKDSASLLRLIETVQKSFVVGGASTQEAQSSALQLAQALGSGRLQGDELRSILENNIPLASLIAKEFGVARGELKGLGSEGLLTSDRVIKAIIKGADDIDAAFGRTTPRVNDGFQALNNAITFFVGRLDQSTGTTAAIANGLIALADNFDQVGNAALFAAAAIGGGFLGRGLGGLVGGGQGKIAAGIREEINARKEAAKAAQDQLTVAREQAAQARENSIIASEARKEFEAQPRLLQASKQLQAARQAAARVVDETSQKLSNAVDKEAAALLKLNDAQNVSATASTAAVKQRSAAEQALVKAQEDMRAATERRLAAEQALESAGGGVRRTELAKFYKALAVEVDAKNALEDAKAAEVLNRSNIAALERAQTIARSKKDFEGGQALSARIAEEKQRSQQLVNERILAGNKLLQAEKATADAEAGILSRQASEKEKASITVARAAAAEQAAREKTVAATERLARAETTVNESVVKSAQQRQQQVAKLESEALAARVARVKAQANADTASGQLKQIDTQIPVSASQQVAKFKDEEARSSTAYADALNRESIAQNAASVARNAARPGMIALGVAARGLMTATSSLVGFLGGPWGVAFTAAGAALGIFEVMQLRAKQRTEDFKKTLEQVPLEIKRIEQALAGGGLGRAGEAQSAAFVKRLSEARSGLATNIRSELNGVIAGFGTGAGSRSARLVDGRAAEMRGLIDNLTVLKDGSIVADEKLRKLADSLDRMAAADPGFAQKTADLRGFIQQLFDAKPALDDLRVAIGRTIQDPRDLRNAASERFMQDALKNLNTGSDVNFKDLGQNDPTIRELRGRGMLQRQVAEAEANQTAQKVKDLTQKIFDAVNEGGGSTTMGEAENAARQIIAAQSKQYLDLADAIDVTTTAIQALQSAGAGGISPGLTQSIAETEMLISRLNESAGVTLANLGEQLRNAFAGASADVQPAIQAIIDQVDQLAKQGTASDDELQSLIQSLIALGSANPSLAGPISEMLALAKAALTARGQVNALNAALGAAGSADVEKKIQDMVGVPENFTPDIVQKQVADQLRSEITGKKTKTQSALSAKKRAIELQDKTGGLIDLSVAQELAGLEQSIKAGGGGGRRKGGGGGKGGNTAQKFNDALGRFIESAQGAFFDQQDKDVLEKLESLKAAPDLIKRTREAIQNGGQLPDEALKVRNALELEAAAKAYDGIITKYGTLEQLAPRFAQQQRILNIAVQEGKISAEQAATAYGDYVTSFKQNEWINQTADAFGNFVESVATGSASIKDAFKNLLKDLLRIAVQQLLVQPLKQQLTNFFSGLVGGGGGGIFGLFTGGGGATVPFTGNVGGLFHEGGTVGSGGRPIRMSSALISSAPRFHSGLRSDEMAAVLQRGEEVLSRKQRAQQINMISGLSDSAGGGGGVTVVQQNTFQAGSDAANIAKMLPTMKQVAVQAVAEATVRRKL